MIWIETETAAKEVIDHQDATSAKMAVNVAAEVSVAAASVEAASDDETRAAKKEERGNHLVVLAVVVAEIDHDSGN